MPFKDAKWTKLSALLLILGLLPSASAVQSVFLKWEASTSPEAVGYNIYYGSESGVYTTILSVGPETSLSVDGLEEGLTYYFTVTARDAAGLESPPSNEASYGVPGIAPPPGLPFISQILADNAVTLSWNPSPSADIQAYIVRYGTQSGFYDSLLWVPVDSQVDIYNLLEGLTYYFTVSALNSQGIESRASPEIPYTIPQVAPPQAAPTPAQIFPYAAVNLRWEPSPTHSVISYRVYYGFQLGEYEGYFDAGLVDSVDIWGLAENQMYYFMVSAYSATGQESVPSTAAWYRVESSAVYVPDVTLSLQPLTAPGFPNAFTITAAGTVPSNWAIQGSSDLKTWRNVITGNEPDLNVNVVVSEKPALFFRLKSWFEGIELTLSSDQPNAYPGTMVISTPYGVPWDWTLEVSDDAQNWGPLLPGYFNPVKLALINSGTPSLYFRLKGE